MLRSPLAGARSSWLRFGVFGPVPLARIWLRHRLAQDIAALLPHLDVAFYRQQMHTPGMRLAVARDAALHYLLVGAPRLLSPHPAFDAVGHYHATARIARRRAFFDALASGRFPKPPPAPPSPAPGPAGVVLLIDHARGGGASRFLDGYADALHAEGFAVRRAVRSAAAMPLFVAGHAGGHRVFSLDPADRFSGFAEAVAALGVTRLVINHFVDMPAAAIGALPAMARRLGLDYEIVLHDYHLACPRITLVDRDGRFCDLAPPRTCARCLGPGGPDIATRRAQAALALDGAARVTVPGRDLARRLGRAFPAVPFVIREPEEDPRPVQGPPLPRRDGRLRIGVVGALSEAKGFHVLAGLARLARRRGEHVRFVLIGHSMKDPALRRAGVTVTGRYAEAELEATLRQAGLDLLLFPAIWPETWSFTLTAGLRWGGAIAAFEIGAIADRLRRTGRGTLLPLAMADRGAELLDTLLALARDARAGTTMNGEA